VTGSHDKCEKLVYRLCSSCISSVQKLNKNSIKFFLLTQIRSRIKHLLLSLTKLQLSKRLAVQFPSVTFIYRFFVMVKVTYDTCYCLKVDQV